MSTTEEFKNLGNLAFQRKDYAEAIEHFSKAIALDGNNHILFSNRSASYAGVQDFESALKDANKCVELKPDWGKGYGRQGAAYHGLGNFKSAETAYRKGLEVEPGLQMLVNGLSEVQALAREEGSTIGLEKIASLFRRDDLMEIIAKSPKLASFLADKDFVEALQSVRADPKTIAQHLSNEKIQMLLQFLLMHENPDLVRKAEEAEIKKRQEKERQEEEEKLERERAAKLAQEAEKQKRMNLTEADFQDDPRGLSEWLKEKGNNFYKNKEFDQAITLYSKALEADPSNVAVLTNRAAVRFEQSKYEECISDCKEAIETGRSVRADFKIIARAYERMGNAFVKVGRLEEAAKAYSDSLVENRSIFTILDKLWIFESIFSALPTLWILLQNTGS